MSGDRDLTGLAVDPGFPARPYIYLLYTVDAQPGGVAPFYNDQCPLSPSGAKDGCPAAGRLSRVTVDQNTNVAIGPEQIIIGGTYWCHQQQAPRGRPPRVRTGRSALHQLRRGRDGKLHRLGPAQRRT